MCSYRYNGKPLDTITFCSWFSFYAPLSGTGCAFLATSMSWGSLYAFYSYSKLPLFGNSATLAPVWLKVDQTIDWRKMSKTGHNSLWYFVYKIRIQFSIPFRSYCPKNIVLPNWSSVCSIFYTFLYGGEDAVERLVVVGWMIPYIENYYHHGVSYRAIDQIIIITASFTMSMIK